MNNCNLIYIITGIVLLWFLFSAYKQSEGFDRDGVKFMAEWEPRYDLRGVRLNTTPYHCVERRNKYRNKGFQIEFDADYEKIREVINLIINNEYQKFLQINDPYINNKFNILDLVDRGILNIEEIKKKL